MEHQFEGRVDTLDFGKYAYTVVYLPKDLESQLPFDTYPRPRIEGEINDHEIEGAWQPSSVGKYYLILGKKFLKQADLRIGDEIDVRFNLADQDALHMPRDLSLALSEDSRLADIFDTLSIGKKRALVHRVDSAKTQATREKRITEVLSALEQPVGSPLERILGRTFKGLNFE